jgi:hypothetical protein
MCKTEDVPWTVELAKDILLCIRLNRELVNWSMDICSYVLGSTKNIQFFVGIQIIVRSTIKCRVTYRVIFQWLLIFNRMYYDDFKIRKY